MNTTQWGSKICTHGTVDRQADIRKYYHFTSLNENLIYTEQHPYDWILQGKTKKISLENLQVFESWSNFNGKMP